MTYDTCHTDIDAPDALQTILDTMMRRTHTLTEPTTLP